MALVDVKVAGNLGILVLNNGKYNQLNAEVFADMESGFNTFIANDAVKAIVLTANPGPVFCAGADVKMISKLAKSKNPFKLIGFLKRLHQFVLKVDRSPKPVIAAINGVCFGGGLELSLACDYRVAASTAQLALPEVTLGIIPGLGGTQRLPRLIGAKPALQLMLSGERIAPARAKELGVIDRVIEGDFIAGIKAFAAEVLAGKVLQVQYKTVSKSDAALAPEEFIRFAKGRSEYAARKAVAAVAKGATKKSIVWGLAVELFMFLAVGLHPDAKEGTKAFIEKRPAKFAKTVGE